MGGGAQCPNLAKFCPLEPGRGVTGMRIRPDIQASFDLLEPRCARASSQGETGSGQLNRPRSHPYNETVENITARQLRNRIAVSRLTLF